MAEKISYSVEELEIASKNLSDSLNILKNDIEKSINTDFRVLEELGFFSTGVNTIKKQIQNLGEEHNTLISKLSKHKEGYQIQQDSFNNIIEQARGGKKIRSDDYSGNNLTVRETEEYQKEDGSKVKNSYLREVIPLLDSNSKLQMLKNILVYNKGSFNSLFTDSTKANVLVYQIKKMLKDEEAKVSKVSFDDEKFIQKQVIETIAKEGKNLFMDVNDKTFLSGINYYNKVALLNNINVSDLLIDKDKEELLRKAFNDLYFDRANLDGITKEEVERVKEYFNILAKNNNVSVEQLLSNSKYMNVIKEGTINDIKG